MSYATKQNMIDRFGELELIQLTDKTTPKTGAINDATLGKALENAEGEVNGYVSVRYALPLASPPKLLEGLTCDIARYRLFKDRMPSIVEKGFETAIRTLEKIAEGKITLGITSTEKPPAAVDAPTFDGPEPTFTDDALKDYI